MPKEKDNEKKIDEELAKINETIVRFHYTIDGLQQRTKNVTACQIYVTIAQKIAKVT